MRSSSCRAQGERDGRDPACLRRRWDGRYPTFTQNGIQVVSYFRPDLRIGAAVRVESIVPSASGTWKIVNLSHDLTAHKPGGGSWRTTFEGMWLDE